MPFGLTVVRPLRGHRDREIIFQFSNAGKIIAIDLNTRDDEIDTDLIVACDRLKARHPNAVTWLERVGYDAVYAVGGTLVRTAQ